MFCLVMIFNSTDLICNGLLDPRLVEPNADPFSETSTIGYAIQREQTTGGTIAIFDLRGL